MKTLLVSACLLGCQCKYNGNSNICPEVLNLRDKFHLIPVCPEQLGGLPTPRPPAERQDDRVRNRDGVDVTKQFEAGAHEALRIANLCSCSGAILKSRSPSCGYGEIYDGSFSGTRIPGNGVTAQLLLVHGIPICSEENLDKILNL